MPIVLIDLVFYLCLHSLPDLYILHAKFASAKHTLLSLPLAINLAKSAFIYYYGFFRDRANHFYLFSKISQSSQPNGCLFISHIVVSSPPKDGFCPLPFIIFIFLTPSTVTALAPLCLPTLNKN